jgi:hypothetical protein
MIRDLLLQHTEVIRSLCREYGVARLELFGSATRPDFDPNRSDIDLLVEFAPGTDLGPWMSRFIELRDHLQALLKRDVDLVMASGLRNPYLIRAIEHERQLLYAA